MWFLLSMQPYPGQGAKMKIQQPPLRGDGSTFQLKAHEPGRINDNDDRSRQEDKRRNALQMVKEKTAIKR
jgi:hypothetical protein